MYEFRDTTDNTAAGRVRPAEAVNINGEYLEDLIEGYSTLNVSGREGISVTFNETTVPGRDGSIIDSRRVEPRVLVITYQMLSRGDTEFREAYNLLLSKLYRKELKLIFDDEPDKYFVGTLREVSNPVAGTNKVVGTFSVYCAEPYKYANDSLSYDVPLRSLDHYGPWPDPVEITPGGLFKVYPKVRIEFTKAARLVGFLQFIDSKEEYHSVSIRDRGSDDSTVVASPSGNEYTTWTKNGATFSQAVTQAGDIAFDSSLNGTYGGSFGSGSGWHGPARRFTIPTPKPNAVFYNRVWMKASKTAQGGAMIFSLVGEVEGVKTSLFSIFLFKYSSDSNLGSVRIALGGSTVKTVSNVNFVSNNDITGEASGSIVLEKNGADFIARFGGYVYTFRNEAYANVNVSEVNAAWLRYGTLEMLSKCLLFESRVSTSSGKVMRSYPAGTVIEIDSEAETISVNGEPRSDILSVTDADLEPGETYSVQLFSPALGPYPYMDGAKTTVLLDEVYL